MQLLCAGISHRTTGVELRERIAMGRDAVRDALCTLRKRFPDSECAILSTCNRTEFYIASPDDGSPDTDAILELLQCSSRSRDGRAITVDDLRAVMYRHDDQRAVRHLFRVASGIDSMVLGENQILGQVKRAYELAQSEGTVGPALHKIFQKAMGTGKRVRSETGIGGGRLSVSSVAVDFARHLFHRLDDKSVLCIGAGKMAELTLERFMSCKPRHLRVCNRSVQKAEDLARRYGRGEEQADAGCAPAHQAGPREAQAGGMDALPEHLVEADVVISSTGANQPIVTRRMFKPLVRRRRFRPLFVIDIAVPRDFEPRVGAMSNVYLYNLDDLQQAIRGTSEQRGEELEACERLAEGSAASVWASLQNHQFAHLIRELREQLHEIGYAEASRTRNRLAHADPEQMEKILEEHSHRLVNKILHRPVSELNRRGNDRSAMYAAALRGLFDLEDEHESSHPNGEK